MAVTNTKGYFTCLSTDTKPPASNGDLLIETDTGDIYTYSSSWTLLGGGASRTFAFFLGS